MQQAREDKIADALVQSRYSASLLSHSGVIRLYVFMRQNAFIGYNFFSSICIVNPANAWCFSFNTTWKKIVRQPLFSAILYMFCYQSPLRALFDFLPVCHTHWHFMCHYFTGFLVNWANFSDTYASPVIVPQSGSPAKKVSAGRNFSTIHVISMWNWTR